ncbi:MAG: Mur ligase family protein [Patescibacteria group bacterium]
MFFILSLISFFWLIRTLKAVLFWIYLWQLKEYHIGRFLDHFRTHKGKKIFFNFFFAIKLLLLPLFFLSSTISFYILLAIYVLELIVIAIRGLKRPVLTLKTILLTLVLCLIVISYLLLVSRHIKSLDIVYYLLLLDIFTPAIVSAVVLLVQPVFVYFRIKILKKAAKKITGFKDLTVIGITGSYGKTSTKEFLTTILSSRFKVLSTKDHKNSEMGIAQTILNELKPEHQVFVVEMGAYNKGGIKLLCDIVRLEIGIVTGVNEQHLSTFKSIENLLSAEGGQELLKSLPHNGLLAVNGDNKYCLDLYKRAKTIGNTGIPIAAKVYTLLGNKVSSDIWAEEISVHEDSLDFMTVTKEKEAAHFNVNIPGRQNIQNLLGAILVAKELGMTLEDISLAARNIKQEQAGIILKRGIRGINIIDSSYSSNPDGVMADLDYLNVFKGKKVIVMPCLIELGKKSKEVHQQIGKKIAEVCDMAVITTKDKFEDIKAGAMNNRMPADKIIFNENPKKTFQLITMSCKSGDVILLEGGRPKELIKLLINR